MNFVINLVASIDVEASSISEIAQPNFDILVMRTYIIVFFIHGLLAS
jgi:hypothetical protein